MSGPGWGMQRRVCSQQVAKVKARGVFVLSSAWLPRPPKALGMQLLGDKAQPVNDLRKKHPAITFHW